MRDSRSTLNGCVEATVLSVGAVQTDHVALQQMLRKSNRIIKTRWKLVTASTLPRALTLMRQYQVAIVFCEQALETGSWRDLVAEATAMPQGPMVIVTSRLADERLWTEVLNQGGYDLLSKPFDPMEVTRVIEGALRRWASEKEFAAGRRLLAANCA